MLTVDVRSLYRGGSHNPTGRMHAIVSTGTCASSPVLDGGWARRAVMPALTECRCPGRFPDQPGAAMTTCSRHRAAPPGPRQHRYGGVTVRRSSVSAYHGE